MGRIHPTRQHDQAPEPMTRRQGDGHVIQKSGDPQRHLSGGGGAQRHESPSNLRRGAAGEERGGIRAGSPTREQTVPRRAERGERRARAQDAVVPLHRRGGLEGVAPDRFLRRVGAKGESGVSSQNFRIS